MHTPVEHSSLFSYSPFRSKHVPRRPVKLKTLETTANQQAGKEQEKMEQGEDSGSKPSDEIWSKLVPSDNKFSDVELRLDEVAINSDVKISSFKKQEWCKITRNPDLSSATLQNKSLNVIFVDGTDVAVPDGAPLSIYQCFQNMRNFLVATGQLGLPTFEPFDLEQGGKSSKIVNCIVELKSYSEWKQTGIPPFNAESPQQISGNIMNRDIPWPKIPEEISFEAYDLINNSHGNYRLHGFDFPIRLDL
ncbi:hypothetical protein L2E82_24801 [Cichorium intybus]|uniref:Uncharacterized protein n=1 Tax=Cichorium intybus TaxID=13427 RepID=A0ACB9E1H4_CICIN|nr:hypothetical protein L2E82_24801 [Cichorium intybus]